jgi:transcription initiation factor TFIID subunit 6
MAKESQDSTGTLSADSMRIMAESIGISGLSDEAVSMLSEDVVFRLKELIQEASKVARHSRRKKMTTGDIDCALRTKNVEPVYGFDSSEYLPFRHTSGGGKEIFYVDDKEMDLMDFVTTPLPKVPLEPSIHAHWLAVDGIQPVVPENPPQLSVQDQQKAGSVAVLPSSLPRGPGKANESEERMDEIDQSKLKPLTAHSLSMEQQMYFIEITEAIIGLSDQKRQEALMSLSTDTGLYQLLPYFSNFFVEGVRVNIAQRKLPPLRHLLKMLKALLDNTSISLEKCLHEIVPGLVSCIISRQVCQRPEIEDHWSLKETAAKLMAAICKRFDSALNNLQARYTRILTRVLNDDSSNITMHYGAIAGLSELGTETITSIVLPKLSNEASIIQGVQQSAPAHSVDEVGATKLQTLLVRSCSPVLVGTRPVTDTVQMYQKDYGHLGSVLFGQVQLLRKPKLPTLGGVVSKAWSLSAKTPVSGVGVRVQTRAPPSVTTPTTPSGMKPPPLQLGNVLRSPTMTSRPRLQSPVSATSPFSPALIAAVINMQSSNPSSPGVQSPTLTSPPVTQSKTQN